jgi:hypothetical protein
MMISSDNGYGVTSLVGKCVPNEFLLLRHTNDTEKGTARCVRISEGTAGSE